jgi:hypothetical protein
MGTLERHIAGEDESPPTENLDPHHFYAAYVFESAALRRRDVATLFEQAHRFENGDSNGKKEISGRGKHLSQEGWPVVRSDHLA